MTDQAGADRKEPLPGDSEDDEDAQSWLRRAVREPEAPRANARLPVPGDIVDGKYRIDAQIGRGGMGEVFRATQLLSERAVAIKWMLSPASDDRAHRRFLREARAVGRIDHPNVVALYDVGQDGDRIYLVMELLRGESLRRRLARGQDDAAAAIELLLPAMHGVAAAHEVGVIHRDLKPDNIFVCEARNGRPGEAKVLDFGVASIAMSETADSTLTKDGTLLGSPAYMSPEQLKNPHAVDAQTDVYAFGMILYEALAGALPFPTHNYAALIFAIETAVVKPLSQVKPDIPPALEQVVMRALARERATRHPTMNSLIEALEPFGSTGS